MRSPLGAALSLLVLWPASVPAQVDTGEDEMGFRSAVRGAVTAPEGYDETELGGFRFIFHRDTKLPRRRVVRTVMSASVYPESYCDDKENAGGMPATGLELGGDPQAGRVQLGSGVHYRVETDRSAYEVAELFVDGERWCLWLDLRFESPDASAGPGKGTEVPLVLLPPKVVAAGLEAFRGFHTACQGGAEAERDGSLRRPMSGPRPIFILPPSPKASQPPPLPKKPDDRP